MFLENDLWKSYNIQGNRCLVYGIALIVPEGRNMSTIKDEEEIYQSLKNISKNLNDNKTAKVNTILMEHLFS